MASPNKTKNVNRKLCNKQLSVLPPFTPMNNYEIFLINKSTNTDLLHHVIQLAQNTKYFSIDTKSDYKTNVPALIQIEFIHEKFSTVILVEVCDLPVDKQTLIFWLIRAIFKYIFQDNKIIYSWGEAIKELSQFVAYHLFSMTALHKPEIINLQNQFKIWHYNEYHFYAASGNLWGLQAAVADCFQQFLDKSQTLNKWSCGLHQHRSTNNYQHNNINKIESMINYAADDDCLAVTKLAHHIGQLNFI